MKKILYSLALIALYTTASSNAQNDLTKPMPGGGSFVESDVFILGEPDAPVPPGVTDPAKYKAGRAIANKIKQDKRLGIVYFQDPVNALNTADRTAYDYYMSTKF